MVVGDLPLAQYSLVTLGWIQLAVMGGLALANALGRNRQQNRESQNNAAMSQDQIRNDQYRTQQNALLQALLGQSNEQVNLGNLDLRQRSYNDRSALLGSMMQNMQPVRLSGLSPQVQARMPQISGGLNPSLLSQMARLYGQRMQQNSLGNQKAMGLLSPLKPTNFQGALMPPPALTPHRGPGTGESILGLLGAAGNLYGAYRSGVGTTPPYNPSGSSSFPQAAPTYVGWRLPQGDLLGNG